MGFSYRHLHYFWVVAKEGGMSRAAERLGVAVQTVSTQVRELEQALGCALLRPAGRGVALTDAGQAALAQADLIFQLGEQLPAAVRAAATGPSLRLAVGVTDGLPKLAVQRLLAPVLDAPYLRLLCHDGELPELMAELALHKLDLILCERMPTPNPNLRVHTHQLEASEVAWYGVPELAQRCERAMSAQTNLARAWVEADVPFLLPSAHNVLREGVDRWFEQHGQRPRVFAECEDSALLMTFGAGGMGIFPAPTVIDDEMTRRYRVRRIALCEGVQEAFYAITPHQRIGHPLVAQLTQAR